MLTKQFFFGGGKGGLVYFVMLISLLNLIMYASTYIYIQWRENFLIQIYLRKAARMIKIKTNSKYLFKYDELVYI